MGETQAFGTSLFCLSRRLFILAFCLVGVLLCIVHLASFAAKSSLLQTFFNANTNTPRPAVDCVGLQCYEVFSCFGFKETTFHIRTPFFYVFGLFFFALGAHGAHHGLEKETWLLHRYLLVSFIFHVLVLAADGLYTQQCSAYPLNVVEVSLTGWLSFPPIGPLAKEQLRQMPNWPIEDVKQITNGFKVLLRYFVEQGFVTLALLYGFIEAYRLAAIEQKGPLGLGTFYGLSQWDEVLDHDVLRRRRERQIRSKFIDDARLPLKPQGDAELGSGFTVYGSAGVPGHIAAVVEAASQEHDDWGFDYPEDEAAFQQEHATGIYGDDGGEVDHFLHAQDEEAKLAWRRFEHRRQLA